MSNRGRRHLRIGMILVALAAVGVVMGVAIGSTLFMGLIASNMLGEGARCPHDESRYVAMFAEHRNTFEAIRTQAIDAREAFCKGDPECGFSIDRNGPAHDRPAPPAEPFVALIDGLGVNSDWLLSAYPQNVSLVACRQGISVSGVLFRFEWGNAPDNIVPNRLVERVHKMEESTGFGSGAIQLADDWYLEYVVG